MYSKELYFTQELPQEFAGAKHIGSRSELLNYKQFYDFRNVPLTQELTQDYFCAKHIGSRSDGSNYKQIHEFRCRNRHGVNQSNQYGCWICSLFLAAACPVKLALTRSN